MLLLIVLVVAAYAIGSVASAVIVCRALGIADPREVGSGNPGATNVLRHGGKKAAIVTLLGDAGKGVLPVVAGHLFGFAPPALTAIGAAAFVGHLFPIFYGFKGGKGVATFVGVNFALDWRIGAAFAAVWLLVALVTRYSSLAALLATALTPVVAWYFAHPAAAIALYAGMGALIFWRHQRNIRDLLTGREKKIGEKSLA